MMRRLQVAAAANGRARGRAGDGTQTHGRPTDKAWSSPAQNTDKAWSSPAQNTDKAWSSPGHREGQWQGKKGSKGKGKQEAKGKAKGKQRKGHGYYMADGSGYVDSWGRLLPKLALTFAGCDDCIFALVSQTCRQDRGSQLQLLCETHGQSINQSIKHPINQ